MQICQTNVSPNFNIIRDKPAVDRLSGVRHEHAALERGLGEEPGQRPAVVQVETKHRIYVRRLYTYTSI